MAVPAGGAENRIFRIGPWQTCREQFQQQAAAGSDLGSCRDFRLPGDCCAWAIKREARNFR